MVQHAAANKPEMRSGEALEKLPCPRSKLLTHCINAYPEGLVHEGLNSHTVL